MSYTVAVLLMGLQFMKSDLNIVHSPATQSLILRGLLTIKGFTIVRTQSSLNDNVLVRGGGGGGGMM